MGALHDATLSADERPCSTGSSRCSVSDSARNSTRCGSSDRVPAASAPTTSPTSTSWWLPTVPDGPNRRPSRSPRSPGRSRSTCTTRVARWSPDHPLVLHPGGRARPRRPPRDAVVNARSAEFLATAQRRARTAATITDAEPGPSSAGASPSLSTYTHTLHERDAVARVIEEARPFRSLPLALFATPRGHRAGPPTAPLRRPPSGRRSRAPARSIAGPAARRSRERRAVGHAGWRSSQVCSIVRRSCTETTSSVSSPVLRKPWGVCAGTTSTSSVHGSIVSGQPETTARSRSSTPSRALRRYRKIGVSGRGGLAERLEAPPR